MPKFTIVISDRSKHDAGYKKNRLYWSLAASLGGYGELCLYWFLREYYGGESVELLRPSELLRRSATWQTDYLMVGVPTRLSREHLKNVRYGRMLLYDSSDHDGINFLYSDEQFLLSKADCCLKHFRDRRWSLPVRIGLLPIKRPPLNNRLYWKLRRCSLDAVMPVQDRPFDVGFVARPTGDVRSNVRLRWLVELAKSDCGFSRWGGLVGGPVWQDEFADHAIPADCWMGRKKVGFSEYFDGLCQSKVALAPSGYAPWTFRHYEAIYAGCMLVTEDLDPYDFLVPIPSQSVVQVGPGKSVVDGVREAVDLSLSEPNRVVEARRELEKWIDQGRYSKGCHLTLDRFWKEMET